MDANIDYEVFTQQGTSCYCDIENGEIISAMEEDLSGIAIREINSMYKKMLSTTHTVADVSMVKKKLQQYEKNIHLVNEREKRERIKAVKLDENIADICREISLAAAPLHCSFKFVNSQKEVYCLKEQERKTCYEEKYAFWVVENQADRVLHRLRVSTFAPEKLAEYIFSLQMEKACLMFPLNEVAAKQQADIFFAQEASCVLYHEIFGHAFEASKAVECVCFDIDHTEKLLHCPIGVWDIPFSPGVMSTFDDEGVTKNCTKIILDGCPHALLTDKYCCPVGKELTGNGRRSSIYFFPETRMYKIQVQPGVENPSEMMRTIQKAFVVTRIYRGNMEHKSGIVNLYAYISGEIIEGICYPQNMYVLIRDSIVNFYKGIYEISNTANLMGIHCVSGSGPLYTEAETPDTLVKNVHIEKAWTI